MNARIKWLDHMSFIAETGSGHSLVMDGPPDHGGRNLAARPMEVVLAGLGGCSAFDVVDILRKSRVEITDCVVDLTAERADTVPAVFTHVHAHYIVSGPDLDVQKVKRAVSLSVEKYCSVIAMLRDKVEITYDFEVSE